VKAIIVVENPARWPLEIEGAAVVPARAYLTEARFPELRRAMVYNLCRDYSYQRIGYYVSLLAEARGHRPLPSVATLQTLSNAAAVRTAAQDLDDRIRRSLAPLTGPTFELPIYFGRTPVEGQDRLARALFALFPAPLLRARFAFDPDDRVWELRSLRPLTAGDIPDEERPFVTARAREHFARGGRDGASTRRETRFDLGILWSASDPDAPSDDRAIARFRRACDALGIGTDLLEKDDMGRLAEYDGLWIRETTAVNHHTYRFARRAAAEGLVVIDDPETIIRCSNKVYQTELFRRLGIPLPPTLVVHRGNVDEVAAAVGLPCVLKRPDGSFSRGVVKVSDPRELRQTLDELLRESELVVAQAWVPSDFDWRIGVLDRKPLFAARYHMARGHWQIIRQREGKQARYGKVEAVSLDDAPAGVVATAVRAASAIGDGLFGVDLKEVDGRFLVVEVNDNPNIEAGYEDTVLKDELYRALARWFLERFEARGRGAPGGPP
jgi:glutathione synthase/RimK-type ligase-like ATP-grasp enzyme